MSPQEKRNAMPSPSRAHFAAAAILLALVAMPTAALAGEPATPPAASAMPMDHATGSGANAHAGMSMTGDVDYDFAVNMRKHHQMALTMAEAQLRNGKSTTLRDLATEMIGAQKQEISQLDRWIATSDHAPPAPGAH